MPGNSDTMVGFCHLRKASCMMGWDWGPRLPDAGIWKDIYLLSVDSDRLTEIHITQRHEAGQVFVLPQVKTSEGRAQIRVTVTGPDGVAAELPANAESEIRDPHLRCEVRGDEITVYADCYAKSVEIDSPDSDFVLSDNYFDMDGGSRTVKILRGQPKTLRLRSVYDIC